MLEAIEISGLSYAYPDGAPALQDIHMDVAKDSTLGIIGPNGAGKSTLLLHLNGLLQGKGNIFIFGIKLCDATIKGIREKVGLVFQDPDNQLFMPTVFDDVAFGPVNMGLSKGRVEEMASWALNKVGMLYARDKSSNHLSLGEKKRVAIASVLSMKPRILVLDEPTSNLDPKSRSGLVEVLKEIGGTQIIASHDLDLIYELCDHVAVMNHGRIASMGHKTEILGDAALLKRHDLLPRMLFH
ncbi:MAG: ABC transporter ATP-binding protein [Candidatus Omnitrophota bacterium]